MGTGKVVPHRWLRRAGSSGTWLYGGSDLAQEDTASALMQRITSQGGRLDALVNVARWIQLGKARGGTLEAWDIMHRLNLRTAVVSCKAALPF